MNFADILEEWESSQLHSGRQKSFERSCGAKERQSVRNVQKLQKDSEKRVNPIDFWMRRHGVFDKDAYLARAEKKHTLLNTANIKKLPIEASLDLHGLVREEAWMRLNDFINECSLRRLKKVLIVHGKGNHSEQEPVLKNLVRSFIEQDKRIGSCGHPGATEGGSGATWLIIRPSLL